MWIGTVNLMIGILICLVFDFRICKNLDYKWFERVTSTNKNHILGFL